MIFIPLNTRSIDNDVLEGGVCRSPNYTTRETQDTQRTESTDQEGTKTMCRHQSIIDLRRLRSWPDLPVGSTSWVYQPIGNRPLSHSWQVTSLVHFGEIHRVKILCPSSSKVRDFRIRVFDRLWRRWYKITSFVSVSDGYKCFFSTLYLGYRVPTLQFFTYRQKLRGVEHLSNREE